MDIKANEIPTDQCEKGIGLLCGVFIKEPKFFWYHDSVLI